LCFVFLKKYFLKEKYLVHIFFMYQNKILVLCFFYVSMKNICPVFFFFYLSMTHVYLMFFYASVTKITPFVRIHFIYLFAHNKQLWHIVFSLINSYFFAETLSFYVSCQMSIQLFFILFILKSLPPILLF